MVRKMKVIAYPHQCVDLMISEVENHLQRRNLKFKYGRRVLKEGKTYTEQGVEHGGTIVVTPKYIIS